MEKINYEMSLQMVWEQTGFFNVWNIQAVMDIPMLKIISEPLTQYPIKECHNNVRHIQTNLGGKTILGFSVSQYPDNKLWFVPHSIWETPENEYVDITLESGLGWKDYRGIDSGRIKFCPVVSYDANEELYFTPFEFRFHSVMGLEIWSQVNPVWKTLPMDYWIDKFEDNNIKGLIKEGFLFHRDYPITEEPSWNEYIEENNLKVIRL